MEYMLFIATDTEPEPQDTGGTTIEEWCDEGERRGIRKQGERLRPPPTPRPYECARANCS